MGVMTSPLPNVVGLAEAARITGRSVSTIRRKKQELQRLGTTTDADGWKIPIEALVQIWGIDNLPPVVPALDLTPSVTPGVSRVSELEHQLAEVQARAERERARAEAAERLAQVHERHIEDLRMSLRMLAQGSEQNMKTTPTATQKTSPKRWWQRR